MEVKTANGIIGIDHIARYEYFVWTIIEPNTALGVPRDVNDLPGNTAYFQVFTPLELPIHLELEGSGLETILHLTHTAEHVHTIDCPFISLFQEFRFQLMDPKLSPRDLLSDLSQTTNVVEMGVGHDDSFYVLQPDPHFF